jgi:hypothetical protein
MFAEHLTRAIAAALTDQLCHLSTEVWKAYAAGALSDDAAQSAAEAIQARRTAHGRGSQAATLPSGGGI